MGYSREWMASLRATGLTARRGDGTEQRYLHGQEETWHTRINGITATVFSAKVRIIPQLFFVRKVGLGLGSWAVLRGTSYPHDEHPSRHVLLKID
jgi:hypothetical protein